MGEERPVSIAETQTEMGPELKNQPREVRMEAACIIIQYSVIGGGYNRNII